jgi:hypothetical protein
VINVVKFHFHYAHSSIGPNWHQFTTPQRCAMMISFTVNYLIDSNERMQWTSSQVMRLERVHNLSSLYPMGTHSIAVKSG